MSQPDAKRQKTHPDYALLYHGGIPGRGEHIRLAFEAAGVPYSDPGNTDNSSEVYAACASDCTGQHGNPPCFRPPMLKVAGAGKGSQALLISQTSNILLYLGPILGLCGADEVDKLHVNELTLTALDLNNEAHDTHHPVATGEYYEDQKEEALRKAIDFRKNRIPKFFGYFERVLTGNKAGKGKYLVGDELTYADTTLWQVVDGILFAFPKEMEARKKEFPLIFTKFYPGIKEEKGIKGYLASGRRLGYSNGIFRHYPELDRQE